MAEQETRIYITVRERARERETKRDKERESERRRDEGMKFAHVNHYRKSYTFSRQYTKSIQFEASLRITIESIFTTRN